MSSKDEKPLLDVSVDQSEEPLLKDGETKKKKRTFKEACTRKNCVAWFKSVKPSTWIKLAIALVVIGGIVAVLVIFRKKISDLINKVLAWVAAPFGPNHPDKNEKYFFIGPLCLAGAYILATVLFIPGLLLTIGAGFIFKNLRPFPGTGSGLLWGTASVSIGSTIGACCAFLLGRTLFRKWIEKKTAEFKIFTAIDRAIGNNGLKLTFLIRLSPVLPFNIVNYALGLTRVSFWKYALASWIGMLPGTILYVYIGTFLSTLTTDSSISSSDSDQKRKKKITSIFTYVGLAVTVGIVVLITYIARKAVKKALAEDEDDEQKEEEGTINASVNAETSYEA